MPSQTAQALCRRRDVLNPLSLPRAPTPTAPVPPTGVGGRNPSTPQPPCSARPPRCQRTSAPGPPTITGQCEKSSLGRSGINREIRYETMCNGGRRASSGTPSSPARFVAPARRAGVLQPPEPGPGHRRLPGRSAAPPARRRIDSGRPSGDRRRRARSDAGTALRSSRAARPDLRPDAVSAPGACLLALAPVGPFGSAVALRAPRPIRRPPAPAARRPGIAPDARSTPCAHRTTPSHEDRHRPCGAVRVLHSIGRTAVLAVPRADLPSSADSALCADPAALAPEGRHRPSQAIPVSRPIGYSAGLLATRQPFAPTAAPARCPAASLSLRSAVARRAGPWAPSPDDAPRRRRGRPLAAASLRLFSTPPTGSRADSPGRASSASRWRPPTSSTGPRSESRRTPPTSTSD